MIKFPRQLVKYDFETLHLDYMKGVRELPKFYQYKDRVVPDGFRFVAGMDWNDGDFGDRHSCFWGGRNIVRHILKEAGVKSLLLYKGNRGIGRALVLPLNKPKDSYLLFNVYGFNNISFISRFLDTYWDMVSEVVDVSNIPNQVIEEDVIYTNGDYGWLYGCDKTVGNVDLGVDVSNVREYLCVRCSYNMYGFKDDVVQYCPKCKVMRKVIDTSDLVIPV
jgi:hypothetical protein